MKKNYWKMVFRTVKGSFSRFLAIFLITALGVGFLVGLLCTSPDIRSSVDDYYEAVMESMSNKARHVDEYYFGEDEEY